VVVVVVKENHMGGMDLLELCCGNGEWWW